MSQAISNHTPMPSISELCRGLPAAWAAAQSTDDHMLAAIERFAMEAPATTMQDAAAQLMIAYGRFDEATDADLPALRSQITHALLSSWRVVAAAAGFDPAAFSGPQYLPAFATP